MTPLENRIWYWIDNTLSVPRKEFGGHAPCPWIPVYRDRIKVIEVTEGVKQPLEQAMQMLAPLNLMAICLAFPRKPPIGTINRCVEQLINQPQYQHLDALVSNHRLEGTVKGVYTGYRECDLIIIQDANKLKFARLASKKAGYYK